MKFVSKILALSIGLACANAALAAASPEEIAKLGKELTGVGAERAGNADGSIPEYTGGLTTFPAGFKPGDGIRPDPFAAEKPLYVVNGANASQYSESLTAVTAELLKRYPTFNLEVFQTHRTVALPDKVLENTLKNAANARSTEGGMSVENVLPGVPFPIPKTGAEAMWNHLLRYQGVNLSIKFDNWVVDANGTSSLSTAADAIINYAIYENMDKVVEPSDIYYRLRMNYTAPVRRAGEGTMAHDSVNSLQYPRKAWIYIPGLRRVKLAPTMAYDTPSGGSAGAATYDDANVFVGALDRYDWKLIGKQEVIVPFNTYRLNYEKNPQSYLKKGHIAPEYVRWEKHRVWVVEATLKPGSRHIYHKRRFYLNEDTWSAVASDQYDASGQLYRGSFAFTAYSYDQKAPDTSAFVTYDLSGGNYALQGVSGPHNGINYGARVSPAHWSPQSMTGVGIR